MPEPHAERLSVYDARGYVLGARTREAAKSAGLTLGAVNVLLVNGRGELLLQRRRPDKENGGRWDKTVGGHVGEGEEFEQAALREAGEELFGDGGSPRVRLVPREDLVRALQEADLSREVVFRRESLCLNLRDVRVLPDGSVRNVVYHVASYLGRTDVPLHGFRPQEDEIAALQYASAATVDALLLRGELAPNMAYLWLTHAHAVLSLPGASAS